MNTATTFHSNNLQQLTAKLIYLLICLLYTTIPFIYAAYILYAGAEK